MDPGYWEYQYLSFLYRSPDLSDQELCTTLPIKAPALNNSEDHVSNCWPYMDAAWSSRVSPSIESTSPPETPVLAFRPASSLYPFIQARRPSAPTVLQPGASGPNGPNHTISNLSIPSAAHTSSASLQSPHRNVSTLAFPLVASTTPLSGVPNIMWNGQAIRLGDPYIAEMVKEQKVRFPNAAQVFRELSLLVSNEIERHRTGFSSDAVPSYLLKLRASLEAIEPQAPTESAMTPPTTPASKKVRLRRNRVQRKVRAVGDKNDEESEEIPFEDSAAGLGLLTNWSAYTHIASPSDVIKAEEELAIEVFFELEVALIDTDISSPVAAESPIQPSGYRSWGDLEPLLGMLDSDDEDDLWGSFPFDHSSDSEIIEPAAEGEPNALFEDLAETRVDPPETGSSKAARAFTFTAECYDDNLAVLKRAQMIRLDNKGKGNVLDEKDNEVVRKFFKSLVRLLPRASVNQINTLKECDIWASIRECNKQGKLYKGLGAEVMRALEKRRSLLAADCRDENSEMDD